MEYEMRIQSGTAGKYTTINEIVRIVLYSRIKISVVSAIKFNSNARV